MNNLTLGDERRRLLRDDRRRPGRLRRRRRPQRRARRDEQHAQHAGRGARARVPAAHGRLRAPARLRRGRGASDGGDGVVRELEALAPLRYSLITERRRHAPPGARGRRAGRPGRNLLDGEELGPKVDRRAGAAASACGSRPRGGGFGEPSPSENRLDPTSRVPAGRRHHPVVSTRVAFLGLGIMGSRMAANLARAGFDLTGLEPNGGEGRALRRASTARAGGRRPRRPPPRPRSWSRWSSTAPRSRRSCSARTGAAVTAAAAERCSSTARRSGRRPRARSAAELAERGVADARRARDGLLAQGAGRHADDHGRRRRARTSSTRSPCSRRWAS